MNPFNPRKLLHSKWTAIKPVNREKHFIVTEVDFNEDGAVIHCLVEAVISKRSFAVQWRTFRDPGRWLQGWK